MNENEIIKSDLNQYQKIALLAYYYMKCGEKCPSAAWAKACKRLKINTKTSDKCCPKGAFIGLVEHNYLKGLSQVSSVHTNSKNAKYAMILAWLYKEGEILNKDTTKKAKWEIFRKHAPQKIQPVAENNNGQLDVVEVFHEKGLLNYDNIKEI